MTAQDFLCKAPPCRGGVDAPSAAKAQTGWRASFY